MERVKRLRENLGLTQESFAERAGMKYKHYQSVEAGRKANIKLETLLKLSAGCGVEPWELLKFDLDADSLVPEIAEPKSKYHAGKAPKKPARSKTKSRSR